jgi:hypothetical protein
LVIGSVLRFRLIFTTQPYRIAGTNTVLEPGDVLRVVVRATPDGTLLDIRLPITGTLVI